MKRNGKKTPKERADEFLQPMVEATANALGSKIELARRLTERTGTIVSRDRVEIWLHPNPERRQQPVLGSGLLLKEEFDKLFKK